LTSIRSEPIITAQVHARRLVLIRGVHTAAWFSIESCVGYHLWAGATGRSDRQAGAAAAVVAGECLVFAANGFRCPLTRLAEGAGRHGWKTPAEAFNEHRLSLQQSGVATTD
jgi:hypothetical protein